MKKILTLALALIALATVAGLTFGRNATAPPPLMNYKAGTAVFPIGRDGININFSTPMPSTKYAVVVQATNTAGYSTTSVCTYFNPLHKRTDGFEVQHKTCDNGAGVKLDTAVSLDYVVVEIP
jgi:hypothetical protein